LRKLIPILLFTLVSCATVPTSPPTTCSSVGDCETTSVAYLGPDKTVMHMLQAPALIGGTPVDPVDWPASVYVMIHSQEGDAACSATLVGDRVLFMASHCMDDGAVVNFTAHSNAYTARCTHHPEYKKNQTADWALCITDRPVTGVPFEVMGVGQMMTVGQSLTLSGYGCIRPGGGGGNDGIFRAGNATIKGLPSGKTYDIVTKGGAALCFGDSGGSAYVVSPTGARYVVAVNSRGDISTMSYLPSVANSSFKDWAIAWAKATNNVRICGVHDDAMGCRHGDAVTPPSTGKFELQSKSACVRGSVRVDYLSRKQEIVDAVKAALEKF
jgi:hypothetical protein